MIKLPEQTLPALCRGAAETYTNRPALEQAGERGIYSRISYRQLESRARSFALVLRHIGVAAGERVMILCENRPAWVLAWFGIAGCGAVSVPSLTGFSPEQVGNIARHARISALCLSRSMEWKSASCSFDGPLVFLDGLDEPEAPFIEIRARGREERVTLSAFGDESLHAPLPWRKEEDLAAIIYTSGTSGKSKGVMLSHRNLVFCARSTRALVPLYTRDRMLSVLPLAHTYECSLGLLAPLMGGAKISYLDRPPSPEVLLSAARMVRPTAMVTVPLLIEKIYRGRIAGALKGSALFRRGITRPLAYLAAGRKLNKALGGAIRFFGIGGAPLSPEVEEFLRLSRFPYAPGYGLTEASPLAAGTSPFRFPLGSVGAVPRGVELRISSEGEILVRGPNVMMGYYRDREGTDAVLTGGWLRTGDLGSVDCRGRLFVRGRIKSLILGPSGENIYPEEIEGLLGASTLVEEALVYSGEKGELVALVRISESARAAARALERGLEELRLWVNKKLGAFSRLSRIEVREEPFEKTPTQKIKRYLYVTE